MLPGGAARALRPGSGRGGSFRTPAAADLHGKNGEVAAPGTCKFGLLCTACDLQGRAGSAVLLARSTVTPARVVVSATCALCQSGSPLVMTSMRPRLDIQVRDKHVLLHPGPPCAANMTCSPLERSPPGAAANAGGAAKGLGKKRTEESVRALWTRLKICKHTGCVRASVRIPQGSGSMSM